MRKSITSALAVAAAAAAVGGTGIAVASTHSGTTGPENFQMMTTSATGSNDSVIASGLFTAGGVDHEGRSTATFVFSNGTVTVKHSRGTGTQTLDPKTCLLTVNLHGTYTLTGGTGAYAGITGGGKYKLNILAIGAKSGSTCSQKLPPVAFHQVINATGTATLP
jgi:hypothetical protein